MARKLKITENEKYTLQDVKYGGQSKQTSLLSAEPLVNRARFLEFEQLPVNHYLSLFSIASHFILSVCKIY